MIKILYIGEGEIEKRSFDFLNQNDFIQTGLFRRFNLMQEKLSGSNDLLKKIIDKVYCVLDTDCVETTNFDTLLLNVKMLRSILSQKYFSADSK